MIRMKQQFATEDSADGTEILIKAIQRRLKNAEAEYARLLCISNWDATYELRSDMPSIDLTKERVSGSPRWVEPKINEEKREKVAAAQNAAIEHAVNCLHDLEKELGLETVRLLEARLGKRMSFQEITERYEWATNASARTLARHYLKAIEKVALIFKFVTKKDIDLLNAWRT